MKTLLIHEVSQQMLDIDLSQFDIITFDDGLYTQYLYYKEFLKLKKPLYFFISTGIVNPGTYQTNEFIHCAQAHDLFFKNGDLSHYMNWEQIHEMKNAGCIIGGHSHSHPNLNDMNHFQALKKSYYESKLMIDIFNKQNIKIDSFSFPYNDYIEGYMVLKQYGIKHFFGDERIEIEKLIF